MGQRKATGDPNPAPVMPAWCVSTSAPIQIIAHAMRRQIARCCQSSPIPYQLIRFQ